MTKGSHPTRAPDVAATLAWTSSRNPFGVAGAQTVHSSKPGPIADGASGHGGLSPWVVRNTLVLWGSDFKSRTRVEAPASLADLMPTVLKVLAIEDGALRFGLRAGARRSVAGIAGSAPETGAADGDNDVRCLSGRAPAIQHRRARLRRPGSGRR